MIEKSYNFVRSTSHGHYFIHSKNHNLTDGDQTFCNAGVLMVKDDKEYFNSIIT